MAADLAPTTASPSRRAAALSLDKSLILGSLLEQPMRLDLPSRQTGSRVLIRLWEWVTVQSRKRKAVTRWQP